VSTVAVLTCQKRAAAPTKPGELSKSFAMRLCDELALAGMVGRYCDTRCIAMGCSLIV
jgi:hypothetical protein